MVAALMRALHAHDPAARGHGARVGAIAEAFARSLGWELRRLVALRVGARLHDVGKVVVPAAILRKPGPLSEDELREIHRHPAAGAAIVARLDGADRLLPYVRSHHERWDGTGYPDGIAGEAIPIEARLLAVADAFDAMTSVRPYRRPLRPELALEEIERCGGSQFDPALATAFRAAWTAGVAPRPGSDAPTASPRPRASSGSARSPRR